MFPILRNCKEIEMKLNKKGMYYKKSFKTNFRIRSINFFPSYYKTFPYWTSAANIRGRNRNEMFFNQI
ncbi:hypothetical protein BH10BAC5_BH10BAC5_19960 [soil metagenome]